MIVVESTPYQNVKPHQRARSENEKKKNKNNWLSKKNITFSDDMYIPETL